MKFSIAFLIILFSQLANAQSLHLKPRSTNALTGSAFAKTILDSNLTLKQREDIIFKEIKKGNVPNFLRILMPITDSILINNEAMRITYFVLPDYFCIGSDNDYWYVPMTPILAQKVADLTNCSLPTKKLVDKIYQAATIKLVPQPIPPSKAMTTVPIFLAHSDSISVQLLPYKSSHLQSSLTAGHKKDVIISNKIYGEKTPRVVIYGWHKMDGKPIQPVYNKHTNTWADYSHGIRLVLKMVMLNNKKISLKKLLANPTKSLLVSDDGIMTKPFYPVVHYK